MVGRIRAGHGRPVVLGDDVVEAIVQDTLHTVPEDGSVCWSTRSMAARYGTSKDTVACSPRSTTAGSPTGTTGAGPRWGSVCGPLAVVLRSQRS